MTHEISNADSSARAPRNAPAGTGGRTVEDDPDGERSPASTASPQLPAGRYGPEPTPRRRRLTIVLLAVAAVLGIAVVVWIGVGQAQDPVRWADYGFKVESAEKIDVTFEVYMDPGTKATCTIDALAESFAQVGAVDVTVGPSDSRTIRYTVSIPTSELATTGVVESCREIS